MKEKTITVDEWFKNFDPKGHQARIEAREIFRKRVVGIVDKAYKDINKQKQENK